MILKFGFYLDYQITKAIFGSKCSSSLTASSVITSCFLFVSVQHRKPHHWVLEEARNRRRYQTVRNPRFCNLIYSLLFDFHPVFVLCFHGVVLVFHSFSGNNKEMKPRWYGRCSCTSTSSTLQIGTIEAQCPPFCFFMVLHLLSSMHWFVLESVLRYITQYSVFSASLGCTSTTSTHRICVRSGLQSYTWLPYSLGPFVGFLIGCCVRTSLDGTLTHRVMLFGTSLWASILILQTHS